MPKPTIQTKKYEVIECSALNPPYQKRLCWTCIENTVNPGEVGWTGYQIPEAGNAGNFPCGTIFTATIQKPST